MSSSIDPRSQPSSGPTRNSPSDDSPGALGERLARVFLERRGYKVVAADQRLGRLQADLLAWDGGIPVVVEVKTRRGLSSRPEAGLSGAQVERLLKVGAAYFPEASGPVRVDLVTVRLALDRPPEIDLFTDLRVVR